MPSHRTEIVEIFTVVPRSKHSFYRKAIELLHAFIRQNVHPLTAATFGTGCRLEAKCSITSFEQLQSDWMATIVELLLWWNIDYNVTGFSQNSKRKVPVFFHLRFIFMLDLSGSSLDIAQTGW